MPRSVTRTCAWWVTSRFSIPRTSLRGCQHGGTRAAPGASVERGSDLPGGPGSLVAGPGEVPGHSPSPYSPECEEEVFCEVGLPLYGVLGSWVEQRDRHVQRSVSCFRRNSQHKASPTQLL